MIRRVSTPTPDAHGSDERLRLSPTLPGDGSEVGTLRPSDCAVDVKLHWDQSEAVRVVFRDPNPIPAPPAVGSQLTTPTAAVPLGLRSQCSFTSTGYLLTNLAG